MSNWFSWLKTTVSSSSSTSSISNQYNNDDDDKEEKEEDIINKVTTLSINSTISSCSSFGHIEEEIFDNTNNEDDDNKSIPQTTTILKKIYYYDKNAKQVYLTGDFDQWKGTTPMIKQDNDDGNQGKFIADVYVSAEKIIYYKFIVDGKWIYDETLPHEKDKDGNINNVIYTS